MIPRRITGANARYVRPANWVEERDGKCVELPVRMSEQQGMLVTESAWEPTPAELEVLKNGGSIVLRCFGGQPPVWLGVEQAVTDEGDGQ